MDQTLLPDSTITLLEPGFAWASLIEQGHRLRIRSANTVHVVVFDHANRKDRFDDSRTKGNPNRMYVTAGDYLISKFNCDLMKIVADDGPAWSHDLLTGMCMCAPVDRAPDAYTAEVHAWGRLAGTLGTFGVAPYDIPTPLNLFKSVRIDGKTGRLTSNPRPVNEPGTVELRAEIACLVGLCVSGDASGATQPAEISIHAD